MGYLVLLGLVFAYAVYLDGGATRWSWELCLPVIGLTGLIYWLRTRRTELAPPLEGWLLRAALLLPAYAAVQAIPLPLPVLQILSPARAELQVALSKAGAAGDFASLSVVPPVTLRHGVTLAGLLVVLLLVRELAWRWPERRWTLASPFVFVAALEAALGIAQAAEGDGAHGTYVNHNHFAGLLEMALPFAVVYAVVMTRRVLRSEKNEVCARRLRPVVKPVVGACVALSAAVLIVAGVVASQSRMGFVSALTGLAAAMVLLTIWCKQSTNHRRNALAVALAVALAGAGLALLPSEALVTRFGHLAQQDLSTDTRTKIWNETLALIAAYPVFGCGFGGYESAFLKFKSAAPMYTVDYAHNDYLQGVAELGVAGFLLAACFLVAVVRTLLRGRLSSDREERCFIIACLGAMTAILLHSITDFNLYMPANAMLLAWICGAGLGSLRYSPGGAARIVDVAPAR
ncbi:MAG TPA: O-antigen ligase family protein [Bryobacteraceae bacterium]|nr:O-antigen ligase family protein [Bryobacteraceae bacterium]